MSLRTNPTSPHRVASTVQDATPKVVLDLEGLAARVNNLQVRLGLSGGIVQQIVNAPGGGGGSVLAGNGLSFESDGQTLDVNVDGTTINIISDVLGVKNDGIGPIQLADTAVTIGTYGLAASVAQFTVDQEGRITFAGNVAIAIDASQTISGVFATARIPLNTIAQPGAVATAPNNTTQFWRADATWGTPPSGTVTSFSAGNLSPLFTTSVATSTTTPALSFAQVTQSANLVFAGPTTGAAANPTFRSLVAGDIPALSYVTSVGLSLPAMFTVSGSPVTASGTLTAVLANQSANTGFMGPSSGGAAAPTFRALVSADLPLNTTSQAGAVTTAPGGTLQFWRADATWAAPSDTTNGSSLVFAQTSPVTVATNAETTLTSTGTGSLTISANSATVGQVFTIDVFGIRTTQLATTPTLTFNIYFGAVKIGTCQITDVGNLSNQGFNLRVKVTVINAGASGSVECQGYASFETGSAVALPVAITNTAVVGSIDFTANKLIDVKSQWGSGSQSITCRILDVTTDLTAGTVLSNTVAGGVAGRILYDNGSVGTWNTAGSDTQTLRMNGTVPTFNSILTNDGTQLTVTPTSTNPGFTVNGSANPVAIFTNSTADTAALVALRQTGTPSASNKALGGLNLQGVISAVATTGAQFYATSAEAWSSGHAGSNFNWLTCAIGSTTLTERWRMWEDGTLGSRQGSANATSATGPFLQIPNTAGIPTGAPAHNQTGSTSIVSDSTNKKLWAVADSGSTWRGVNGFVIVNLSPAANSTTAILATTDYEAVTTPATGTCTVTLPDAATRGPFELTIRNVTGGTVSLTVARAGSDTINGGTTSITMTVGQSVKIIPNGTDWQTTSSKSGTNATQP